MNKGTDTRQKVLLTAREIINRKGMGATSIDHIARASGLTKGGLYHYFPDKDTLCSEVLKHSWNEFDSFIASAFDGKSAEEGFNSFFSQVYSYHKKKSFIGGCLFGNTALEMSDSNGDLSSTVDGIFSLWIDRFSQFVLQGQRKGTITEKFCSGEIAIMIIEMLEGALMLSRLKKSETPFRICIENIFRLFFTGHFELEGVSP